MLPWQPFGMVRSSIMHRPACMLPWQPFGVGRSTYTCRTCQGKYVCYHGNHLVWVGLHIHVCYHGDHLVWVGLHVHIHVGPVKASMYATMATIWSTSFFI